MNRFKSIPRWSSLFILCSLGLSLLSKAEVLVSTLPGDASVDNTGQASYSIPLSVPPGTAGMEPTLAISYSSQGGNGAMGVGFSLSGLSSISRSPASRIHDGLIDPVDFDEYDRLVLDGQRLLNVSSNLSYGTHGSEYRTEIDSFSKVLLHGGDINDPDAWFEVKTKSGLIYQYGAEPDAFVEHGATNLASSWAVNKISDTAGNYMEYQYNEDVESGEHLLTNIAYTANEDAGLSHYNNVKFIYEEREDKRFRFSLGAKNTTTRRLSKVEFYAEGNLAHTYILDYEYSKAGNSHLVSVKQIFPNGDEIPRTIFNWTGFRERTYDSLNAAFEPPVAFVNGSGTDHGARLVDLNGDGLIDIIHNTGAYLNSGTNWMDAPEYAPHTPITYSSGKDFGVRFVDVNGDGLVDAVYGRKGDYYYKPVGNYRKTYLNTGNGWASDPHAGYQLPCYIAEFCNIPSASDVTIDAGSRFVDINSDGLIDILWSRKCRYDTNTSGAYTNTGSGWAVASEYIPPVVIVEKKDDSNRFHNWIADHDSNFDKQVQFIDVNKDGYIDILQHSGSVIGHGTSKKTYLNTGSGWSTSSATEYEVPFLLASGANEFQSYTSLSDVNGDGLVDVLYCKDDENVETLLHDGTGWQTTSYTNYHLPRKLNRGTELLDINSDGLVDVVFHNDDGRGAWLNTGQGWESASSEYAPEFKIASGTTDNGARFVDINGDGSTDQVQGYGSSFGANLNGIVAPGRLKRAITGYRGNGHYNTVTDLEYSPLTDKSIYTKGTNHYENLIDIQGPMYVVSSMMKDNGLGEPYYSLYTYGHARSHRERGFLGFEIFESHDPQTGISQWEYLEQAWPLTGAQKLSETRIDQYNQGDPKGDLIKSVKNTYLFDKVDIGHAVSNSPVFYYVAKSTEKKWELGESNTNNLVSEVSTYNWFDSQDASPDIPNLVQYKDNFPNNIKYGNITKIIIDYGDSRQITENEYLAVDPDTWILGRLGNSSVTHEKGSDSITKTADFHYDAGTGLLGRETTAANSPVWLSTDYIYDDFGNITDKIVSHASESNTVQQSIYDDKGRFVVESKNALGHSETIITDPSTGLVKSKTGPNGLTTSWTYDSVGRTLKESRADGTETTTHYDWIYNKTVKIPRTPDGDYVVQLAEYTITTQSSGSAPSKAYYDHQGRVIRKETRSPSGRTVWEDTAYETNGLVVAISDPYFKGDDPRFGYTAYDALGRPSIVTAPDGTQTAYAYYGLVSSVTRNYVPGGTHNSENQVTTTHKNTKGEVLKVVDNMDCEIRYEYDGVGNLVKTIDQLGNTVKMGYDLRGNKIWQDDLDMGVWTYGYNALGQLVAQTNANQHVTSMKYDVLGRMVSRTATLSNGSVESVATWVYDGTDDGCWLGGLRREELREGGTNLTYRRTFAYDEQGRPLLNLYNIDNKWYYTCSTYDEFSRPKFNYRFWRPHELADDHLSPKWNSFVTVNTYNERGAVTKVSDASGHVWWQIDEDDIDAQGHFLKYTYGNGVETINTYDDLTGVLNFREAKCRGAAGNNIQSMQFTFDRLGNLTFRKDWLKGVDETSTYDRLNRLSTAQVGGTASPLSYAYNEIGNITKKGDITDYDYGQNAGPHAVTQADGVTYGYDNCGNMISRHVGTNNVMTTHWTTFNKPSSMYAGHDGSEFTYDINNSRITQISFEGGKGTKKLYLGGFEQEEILASDCEQYERSGWEWEHKLTRVFVSTPVGTVGVRVQDRNDNITRKYFHKDHLGSIVAVTGEQGVGGIASKLAEYAYDAWGSRRNASDWTPLTNNEQRLTDPVTDRGYTGHEMLDHLGLVHMNGRIYDANIGRMLSADPNIPSAGNLQSFNRYSYVNNNPLSYTDPSGFFLKKLWNKTKKFFKKYWRVIVTAVIVVAAVVLTAGIAGIALGSMTIGQGILLGAVAGFTGGFAGTLMHGGSLSAAFKAGIIGAAQGAATSLLSAGMGPIADKLAKMITKVEVVAKALSNGIKGGLMVLSKGDKVDKNTFIDMGFAFLNQSELTIGQLGHLSGKIGSISSKLQLMIRATVNKINGTISTISDIARNLGCEKIGNIIENIQILNMHNIKLSTLVNMDYREILKEFTWLGVSVDQKLNFLTEGLNKYVNDNEILAYSIAGGGGFILAQVAHDIGVDTSALDFSYDKKITIGGVEAGINISSIGPEWTKGKINDFDAIPQGNIYIKAPGYSQSLAF